MKSKHGHRIKTVAILIAAMVAPSAARADEPPAEPDGDESSAAAAPAPAETTGVAPYAPAESPPAVVPEAVAPPPVPKEDVSAAQDIAALRDLSLEDLLAVPAWNVTTASKREESSANAPATVFVVTKEDIYLRGYSTLVDVLKELPGMEITEYVFAPIGTQVAVRGVIGNNKVVVLVNGTRVNPPGGDPLAIHSDFSVREAEQIEIIYGPGSTLYGQDAISAVINIKTKKAGGEHWIDVGAGAGYPLRTDSWLGLNRKVGGAEINGYVHYSDANLTNRKDEFSKEYATYDGMYRLVPEGAAILNNPKRWDRGLNAFLQLTDGNFSTQVWHRQSWRSSAEGRNGTAPFIPDNKYDDVATVMDARYLFKLTDAVSLSSTITFNRFQLLPESRFIVPNGFMPGWVHDHKYSMETSFHIEETISAKIGKRISLLGGFVYGHYDIMPVGTVPSDLNTSADTSSQAGTIDYYTTPGDPSSKVSINRLNNPVYQNVGLYAEATVKLHDRVRLLGGARMDKDERYSEVPFSPRAALIVNPLPELALKAIYTQAFVAPAPYNMFDVYQSWWINTTNLDLKPEKARSFELNAEFRRGNVLAGLSGYYNIQKNLLITGGFTDASVVSAAVYPSPLPGTMPVGLYHDANSGEIRTYGGDVFGRYSLFHNRATAWGSYSYVDSEAKNITGGVEVKSGLRGLGHHNFRLGATFNIIRDKLFANVSGWLRSTPQNVGYNNAAMFGAAPTTLEGATKWPYEVSLNVIYRITGGFEAFTTLKNVTHHHYASVYDATPYPGETFRGIVGLRFRN